MDTITLPPTTVSTPPSECSSSGTYEREYYNSVSGGLDVACFSSRFEKKRRSEPLQVYSPGFCPQGYTSPAILQGGRGTVAVCCPTGFSYYTALTDINFSSSSSVIFAGCISTYPDPGRSTSIVARANIRDLTTTTVKGPVTIWAQPIVVEFRNDLFILATTSSTSSSTQAASRTSLGTQQTSTITSPAVTILPPQRTRGLSGEIKAGIGVGVSLGLLIITLAVLLFFRRHHIQKREAPVMAELEA